MGDNNYVVYTHNDLEGNVRYVGSGRLVRANATYGKSNRGKKYEEWVKLNGKLIVSIVKSNLSKDAAIQLEIELFENYSLTGELLNISKPKRTKPLPSIDDLQAVLFYDESSPSCLMWKGSDTRQHRMAGGMDRHGGYYRVMVQGEAYLSHRLIIILHGISLQDGDVVDHIDNNKFNNKISNLRVVKQSDNSRNRLPPYNRDSEFPVGVKFDQAGNRFVANVVNPTIQTLSGNNKKISKLFSVSKYGYEAALELAIFARKQMLFDLEIQTGISYSDHHKIVDRVEDLV